MATTAVTAHTAAVGAPRFETRHRMRLALEHAGVSVQDMADELGVNRNTLSNYFGGRTTPTRATLIVWALRTGVPLEWLETGSTSVTEWEWPGPGEQLALPMDNVAVLHPPTCRVRDAPTRVVAAWCGDGVTVGQCTTCGDVAVAA